MADVNFCDLKALEKIFRQTVKSGQRLFSTVSKIRLPPRNRAHSSDCFVREANDTEERMRVRFMMAAAATSLLAFGLAGCDGGAKTKTVQAQQVVLEGKSVTATGCVRPVETTSCLVVRGPGGGYYDVSSASPAPDPTKGVAVSLRGRDLGSIPSAAVS
ncbi:hypothetical protein [Caulobacter sp. B11]|uniref:hypothetical protein n=1 Tax=Caulobacter sp. B11 TaxID=2048899 RepID=UPI001F47FDC6|nr:hypothetical protein [Caulobacter sp. B11]